jgi:hypothetical protein
VKWSPVSSNHTDARLCAERAVAATWRARRRSRYLLIGAVVAAVLALAAFVLVAVAHHTHHAAALALAVG